MRQFIKTAVAAILIVLLFACSTPPLENIDQGHPTAGRLFRHRWWNYYLRGLASADRMDYEAALADLQRAIAQRSEDQRMARTYGMHFIDYFPHREQGIIHWLRHDLQAARTELQRSLAHYPSAKAHYYLDRVRRTLIKRRGDDVPPPQIELDLPGTQWWTRGDPVRLSGRVRDPNFVARITVNGHPIYMEGAQKQLDFEQHLALPQGRHTITVTAANLAERTTSRQVPIFVDRQGPWLVVERITLQRNHTLFQGTLFDEAGTASVSVNHASIPIAPGPQAAFSFKLPADQAALAIEARDRLGNATVIHLDRSQWQGRNTAAKLVAGLQKGTALAGLFHARDKSSPLIRIPDWETSQTVYMDQAVLTGSVYDKSQVVSLRINGQDVLPKTGPLVFFSHFVRLKTGPNLIVIESRDAQGNRTQKQITIVRKTPKALLLSERLRVGVLPFDLRGEMTTSGFALQDSFLHQLVQQQRFQVVEREKLEAILQEQQLGSSRLIDTSTAVRLGRLAAAHAMVAGTMIATHTGTEVIGRVIDSETAEILTTVDVYSETHSLIGYREMAQSLALKIHREFPLVDGRVLEKQGAIVFTDLGRPKLRCQRRLIVYQDRPLKQPDTGRFLGYDYQVLGKARVIQCGPGHSKARLQAGDHSQIEPQQKVITQ